MMFEYAFFMQNFFEDLFVPKLKNHSIIIPWDIQLFTEKKKHLTALYKAETNFCISFSKHKWPFHRPKQQTELMHSLSAFFFLPNYLKTSDAPVLLTDIMPEKELDLYVLWAKVQSLLEKQGFPSLSVSHIDQSEVESDVFYFSGNLNNALNQDNTDLSWFPDEVINNQSFNKKILIYTTSQTDFQKKLEALETFENDFLATSASLAKVLTVEQDIYSQYLKTQSDNKKLRFHIANHKDYVKILKETTSWHVDAYNRISSSSAPLHIDTNDPELAIRINELHKQIAWLQNNKDEIFQWYQKEYEVLPMWYKRFGHILKVLMGKRKLKSLLK
ncbi:MAG: hypothetical protein JST42_12860 [Bacteroidetes bacterium]|nr:hypothetical protein [Bacteroidota bacterium]